MLRLHDTASQKIVDVVPRVPGEMSLYVCGPTVYDAPHLGHGRFSLVFDVLRRYLLFSGLAVRYVSNITDIDDKIIERAAEQGVPTGDLAARYEAVWWDAMRALGVMRPDDVPHATEYVDRMVDLVADLVDRGVAYETSDGVYLSVGEVDGYGLLAHQPLDSLRSGARVEVDEEKRSPLDFVLWKKAKPDEPTWPSPWGPGRPGWHTECVVMSLDLLGEGFDIHGGAIDLIFPHHENERAQAVASGREFARHWVHNGWVTMDGEKMSKSLGNFTSLDDLLARSDARAYRLLVLRSHYRSPIEVTPDAVADATRGLERLDELARRFGLDGLDGFDGAGGGAAGAVTPASVVDLVADADAVAEFRAHMDDDLDTPGALAGIFDLVRRANSLADSRTASAGGASDGGPADRVEAPGAVARSAPADVPGGGDAEVLARTVQVLCGALGLFLRGGATVLDADTEALVAERNAARDAREWDRADALRTALEDRGWSVEDGPDGTRVRRGS